MKYTPERQDGAVHALYDQLRSMAASFAFKPGERLNESALSKTLGASRTPLREALNRLAAEGFVDFHPGRGFFCRSVSDARIKHLYEARTAIECEAVRHAARRADPKEIATIRGSLDATADEYASCTDPVRLMELDEDFHLRPVALAENPELH